MNIAENVDKVVFQAHDSYFKVQLCEVLLPASLFRIPFNNFPPKELSIQNSICQMNWMITLCLKGSFHNYFCDL